jgi:hypothetical protein
MSNAVTTDEEERLTHWRDAIEDHHKRWTRKYRDYVKAAGTYANAKEGEAKEREQEAYQNDMEEWQEVKISKIERIDGIFKFFTKGGDMFEMNVGDIYSQTEFRKAFTIGTSIILPSISKTSFERFILALPFTKVENLGITILEKVEEALENQYQRLQETPLVSEEEAIHAVESRSIALFNNCLYFKNNAIMTEMWRSSLSVTATKLVSALRDLGAENIKHRKFNYWKYDMGENTTEKSV